MSFEVWAVKGEVRGAKKAANRLEAELTESRGRLTDRQRRFCDLFTGKPAYRAAALAGYATPRSEGSRLRSMVKVRAVLDLRMELMQAQRTLRRLEALRDQILADERQEAKESRAIARDIERRYGVRTSVGPTRQASARAV